MTEPETECANLPDEAPAHEFQAPPRTHAPQHGGLFERVQPHDLKAERALLGAMLLDERAAAVAGELVTEQDFYTNAHRILFALFSRLRAKHPRLDEIEIEAELKRSGDMERIGGPDALATLTEECDSPSAVERYAHIVIDCARRRALLNAAHEIAYLCHNGGMNGATVDAAREVFSKATQARATDGAAACAGFAELMQSSTTTAPDDILLGRSFLCRGGTILWVGSTGLGKSSSLIQAAACWAAGRDFFGIAPRRPLRICILQAENDAGDCAEMVQGVMSGCDLRLEDMPYPPIIYREQAAVGERAIHMIRAIVEKDHPDIFILDPLFAYVGCDVKDQRAMTAFLRAGLGSIQQQTGVAFIVVHHTNKPPSDPMAQSGWADTDNAYQGSGTNELANWPRAVVLLKAIKGGGFTLSVPKRGGRSGLCGPDRTEAKVIYLQHSKTRVCWEYSESQADAQARETETAANDILKRLPSGTYNETELRKQLMSLGEWTKFDLRKERHGGRVLRSIMDRLRVAGGVDEYRQS